MIKISERSAFTPTETGYIHKGRNVCFEPLQGGIKFWLKGKREFFTVPYDELYRDAERGSVKIPARKVSDAQLAKIVERRVMGLNPEEL